MKKTKRTKTRRRKISIGTQTNVTVLDVEHLQEQVKLLTIENDHLKKCMATNQTLKPIDQKIVKVIDSMNESQTPKKTPISMRGCGCKGNCSTYKCGCMKKDIPCNEACKCDDSVCQNQMKEDDDVQDKENVEEEKQIIKSNLKNITKVKSIFSPVNGSNSTPRQSQSRPSSLHFGSPKKLLFDKENDIVTKKKRIVQGTLKNKSKKLADGKPEDKESPENETTGTTTEEDITMENKSSSVENSPKEMSEDDFNPMKPQRELTRTPTPSHSNLEPLTPCPAPEPIPAIIKEERVSKISQEFNAAEVDWEEYQAQLVSCRKCGRKFHPLRIEKHESCCKKV